VGQIISKINQGGDIMKINNSIGCSVTECKYHAQDKAYCSLDSINVTKHQNATSKEATDCGSFEANRM